MLFAEIFLIANLHFGLAVRHAVADHQTASTAAYQTRHYENASVHHQQLIGRGMHEPAAKHSSKSAAVVLRVTHLFVGQFHHQGECGGNHSVYVLYGSARWLALPALHQPVSLDGLPLCLPPSVCVCVSVFVRLCSTFCVALCLFLLHSLLLSLSLFDLTVNCEYGGVSRVWPGQHRRL